MDLQDDNVPRKEVKGKTKNKKDQMLLCPQATEW